VDVLVVTGGDGDGDVDWVDATEGGRVYSSSSSSRSKSGKGMEYGSGLF
jgi:hypothetical protein